MRRRFSHGRFCASSGRHADDWQRARLLRMSGAERIFIYIDDALLAKILSADGERKEFRSFYIMMNTIRD